MFTGCSLTESVKMFMKLTFLLKSDSLILEFTDGYHPQ